MCQEHWGLCWSPHLLFLCLVFLCSSAKMGKDQPPAAHWWLCPVARGRRSGESRLSWPPSAGPWELEVKVKFLFRSEASARPCKHGLPPSRELCAASGLPSHETGCLQCLVPREYSDKRGRALSCCHGPAARRAPCNPGQGSMLKTGSTPHPGGRSRLLPVTPRGGFLPLGAAKAGQTPGRGVSYGLWGRQGRCQSATADVLTRCKKAQAASILGFSVAGNKLFI